MKITFRYTGVNIWKFFSRNINHKMPIEFFKINKKYIMCNYCMNIFKQWFVLSPFLVIFLYNLIIIAYAGSYNLYVL